MNAWESIIWQSRVNDGYYDEEGLPQRPWQWPTATWFRARLGQVRDQEPTALLKSLRRPGTKSAPELN